MKKADGGRLWIEKYFGMISHVTVDAKTENPALAWFVRVSQRVHVGIWYILRAQRGSHIPTLGPRYILYSYMDPLGLWLGREAG